MLIKLRLLLAWVSFFAMTLFFLGLLDFPIAKVQFFPALLAADFVVVLVIFVSAVLFGRVYCSVLCPLGIFQDLVLWLKQRKKKNRQKFQYRRESRGLRYGILLGTAAALFSGFAILPILLDPYSIYGRMVTHMLTPLWQQTVNGAAHLGERYDLYGLASYDFIWQGAAALVVSLAYFLLLGIAAWRYGRIYCNTICPVGTLLGTVSRYSVFRMRIQPETCVRCGLCEKSCRSSCIDVQQQTIDASRCVGCFSCMEVCPRQALQFTAVRQVAVRKAADASCQQGPKDLLTRREMLATSFIAVGAAAGALLKAAPASGAVLGSRNHQAIRPPGAGSQADFSNRCTACHICVDRCPNQVLTPALLEYGFGGIFQPHVDFSRGYCDYNCNICGSVCPNGAIKKLSLIEKQRLRIGKASYHPEQCLILTEGVECTNCVLHCPTGAIVLEEKDGKKLPKIQHAQCIGCGSCTYHCPAHPPAMQVVGTDEQKLVNIAPASN